MMWCLSATEWLNIEIEILFDYNQFETNNSIFAYAKKTITKAVGGTIFNKWKQDIIAPKHNIKFDIGHKQNNSQYTHHQIKWCTLARTRK